MSSVYQPKELVAHLASNRCSLLYEAYMKELGVISDEQATTLSFAMEGSYEGLTDMEMQLIEKYLKKKVRRANSEHLTQVAAVGGVRIWKCEGHVIYTPVGYKIVRDETGNESQPKPTLEKEIPEHQVSDDEKKLDLTLVSRAFDQLSILAEESAKEKKAVEELRAEIKCKEEYLAQIEKTTNTMMKLTGKYLGDHMDKKEPETSTAPHPVPEEMLGWIGAEIGKMPPHVERLVSYNEAVPANQMNSNGPLVMNPNVPAIRMNNSTGPRPAPVNRFISPLSRKEIVLRRVNVILNQMMHDNEQKRDEEEEMLEKAQQYVRDRLIKATIERQRRDFGPGPSSK